MDNSIETQALLDDFGPIRQLGHVVEDIQASITEWTQQGIGPWLWLRNVKLPCTFEGESSLPVIDVALSYRGDMQIELIQQINDAPSPYLQTVKSCSYGLHHQAFLCDDIHKDVQRAEGMGLDVICDIRMLGSRYVYLQVTRGKQKAYVEFLPASLMMKTMIKHGVAASHKWQGKGEPMVVDLKNMFTLLGSVPAVGKAWLSQR
jgi:hypothetical protein